MIILMPQIECQPSVEHEFPFCFFGKHTYIFVSKIQIVAMNLNELTSSSLCESPTGTETEDEPELCM